MGSVEEADDEKGRIRDEEDLAREVQGVPQADHLLSGDFRREDIDTADSRTDGVTAHEGSF
jgi:hypothetical protein